MTGADDVRLTLVRRAALAAARCVLTDPHLRQDAAQNTLLRFLRVADTVHDPVSWGTVAGRRCALNLVRSTKAWKGRHRGAYPDTREWSFGDTDRRRHVARPEQVAQVRDVERIRDEGLCAMDATALRMIGEGFSLTEVGRALGTSPGAAKTRVWRARRRLLALLGDDA